MKRRIFNAIAAIPFLGAIAFWAASQFRPAGFSLVDPEPGAIKYTWTTHFLKREKWFGESETPWGGKVDLWFFSTGRRAVVSRATPAVVLDNYDISLRYGRYYVLWAKPLLAITAVGLVPTAVAAGRQLRSRSRLSKGLCRRCGYDLRATPDRCPECGAVPAAGSVAPARQRS